MKFSSNALANCTLPKLAFALCCFVSVTFYGYSQTIKPADKIDQYIQEVMIEKHIPGIALAVIKNNKIIKEGFYGVANLEHQSVVIRESVFPIASMTKQFTCAGILLLQQDGKLSVNDKLTKFLKDLPVSWQEITLHQLMNHSCGLPHDFDEETPYFLINNTDSAMLAQLVKHAPRYKPGHDFYYGCGPFLLGLVIADITGKPYGEFLKARIFLPLGMTSTSVYDNRKIVAHRVSGYIFDNNEMTNGMDISPASEARGDVGIISSIPDMIKWDAALNDDRLLNTESRHAMFSQGQLDNGNYISHGYGWYIYPSGGYTMIEHAGGFRTGFTSEIMRVPDLGLSVIFFCNQWNATPFPIAFNVATLADSTFRSIAAMKEKPDPDARRTAALKEMLKKVSQKTWDREALYRQANFCDFSPEDLASFLKGMKELVYIDSHVLKKKSLNLYGQTITKTLFYKVIGERTSYWSFTYNERDKLVSVLCEQ